MRTALEKINRKCCPSGQIKITGRKVLMGTAAASTITATFVGQLYYRRDTGDGYICTAVPSTFVKINA